MLPTLHSYYASTCFLVEHPSEIDVRAVACSLFRCFLKMAKDSAVRIEIGRSFHQLGTVQKKVRESDLVPLWDGTTRRRSLAERKLLEGA